MALPRGLDDLAEAESGGVKLDPLLLNLLPADQVETGTAALFACSRPTALQHDFSLTREPMMQIVNGGISRFVWSP